MRPTNFKILVLAGLGLFLAACGSTPVLRKPVERERVYAKPKNKVWDTIITTLARSGALINNIDKETGLITFTKILSSGEVRNFAIQGELSGAVGAGRFSQGAGLMTILVRSVDDAKTKVYINGRIQIRSTMFTRLGDLSQIVHHANSNGKMEEELLDQVSVEMGEKSFPWLKKGRSAPKKDDRK
ncbi:MAG: hypothetical protein V3S39_08470 [Thermodesulfobacteriota bacterium]